MRENLRNSVPAFYHFEKLTIICKTFYVSLVIYCTKLFGGENRLI